ncbi:hypothetical protein M569_03377, partial [Genlisea aurea]
MPPKSRKRSQPSDPNGMFSGMVVLLIGTAVQPRRLQIWKQRLVQLGAIVEDSFSKVITHVFAADSGSLLQKVDQERLKHFKGRVLNYHWLEDSLTKGEKAPEDSYILTLETKRSCTVTPGDSLEHNSEELKLSDEKKSKSWPLEARVAGSERVQSISTGAPETQSVSGTSSELCCSSGSLGPAVASSGVGRSHGPVTTLSTSTPYNPPDLNRNITEIFGKLIGIYRALGDDRRSFSYYKAVSVIEKLPFRIESVDQVKSLPGIGKSLQDHINEILNNGKLSKLEFFEKDAKVHAISLFGEVWGIGPATALKLYEKGHRTLDDLKGEESLTNAQRLGLKYFDDIKTRIPRHEVQEMESLLKKVGEEILPGVSVVCGGSYRRGKSSCGDMDIVITHPDGKSHAGFLSKFVKRLKAMNFLREELVFSVHSVEGSDGGVDTYFGLCTYPGRELRHRIDFKVYPRDVYAFGLIAWTGNDVLNRRLRVLAQSKGFRLDDTGLFP